MFAQIIWGARPVVLIAFGAGIAATGIAVLIVIAGYLKSAGTLVMIAVITVTGWSYTARQLRSQALSLRNPCATDTSSRRREFGGSASSPTQRLFDSPAHP